ncbi:MAG: A/G-specific adenine glycosylase [Acetobacteraceae bacterium]|nr:A/G-specific adenine glycosylase [Acetobacteraceae bacterium]
MPLPSAAALLRWYDRHRRSMPWRAEPGEQPNPYHVWLSEIMLQQTTVAAVVPYFRRFLERFPTVQALAAAAETDVMAAWAGLGYYARARNLHACARQVMALGGFPGDPAGLLALPGIGPYTAAAIASIGFGVPTVAVDGNVERVAARVFGIERPLPGSRRAIAAAACRLGEHQEAQTRPADFTQALFDLGATVCTSRSPACGICPWRDPCAARIAGTASELPRRDAKPPRPLRHGAQFWLEDASGDVLLERRAPDGLLGGMLGLPGTPWRAEPWPEAEALQHAPQPAFWRLAGQARHGFTHFDLALDVYAGSVPRIAAVGLLRSGAELDGEALPTVMKKCVRLAKEIGSVFTFR